MTDVLLVTGMSGAGRSTVSAALDDLGWFVIDNLPLELIVRVGELAASGVKDGAGVALVQHYPERLHKILFLDAPDDVLIRRYEGTRRRHPHPGSTLAESIAAERAMLRPIRDNADLVIDTGATNVNQLRNRIVETFATVLGQDPMRVSMVSFGYSNGLPRDVDLVFDCRFLPNPHWIEDLRPMTGLDAPVSTYVLEQEQAQHFVKDVVALLKWQIPAFAKEGKSYLSIAIGCTGGKHRSVAIAEEIRRQLGLTAPVFHRDLQR